MKSLPNFLLRCSIFAFAPIAAQAAGTYYNGNYQSPQQQRYMNQSYSAQRGGTYTQNGATYNRIPQGGVGYNNGAYASNRYNPAGRPMIAQQNPQNGSVQQRTANKNNGFTLGGGISHETAMWKFEMKDSGSILRYDDVGWNVLDLHGAYQFDVGSVALKIDAGFKYGMQSGESSMTDDDITNGGYFITQWSERLEDNTLNVLGDQVGHALSIGTSDGGNMYGFNIGLGLADVFKWGNVRFTPSVGYRYFKYKLETKKNYGLAVDTAACFRVNGTDEVQCDPAIIVNPGEETQQIIWRDKITDKMEAHDGQYIDTQGTYYYQQPGTSHSYEVEWTGPYVAMDMAYDINQNNTVTGRVELGFPGYTSTGDQPYRFDWRHPKSVEDKASMFSAMHLGFGAQWMTALTDMISLSLGVTYDYYTVNKADASTYLNEDYYVDLYNERFDLWVENHPEYGYVRDEMTNAQIAEVEQDMLMPDEIVNNVVVATHGDAIAKNIVALEEECSGWVCKASGEIESFYKSLGVRIGVVAKF